MRTSIGIMLCVGIAASLLAPAARAAELDDDGLRALLQAPDGRMPEREGAYRFDSLAVEQGQGRVHYALADGSIVRVVISDEGGQGYASTPSFVLYYQGRPSDSQAVGELMDAVVARVAANDPGGLRFARDEADAPPSDAPPSAGSGSGADARAGPASSAARQSSGHRLPIGGFAHPSVLLAAAAAFVPWLVWIAVRRIGALPRPVRLTVFATLATAALVRLFVVPHLVITQYMGYRLTTDALTLRTPFRYGLGGQVMWHAALEVGGPDHASVLWLHTLLGCLAVLWLVAMVIAAGVRPVGVALVALFAGLMPMLLWAETSDSLTTPVLFFTWGAIVMAQAHLEKPNQWLLSGAVIWLAFAAMIRPESLAFGPLIFAAVLAAQPGPGSVLDRTVARWREWASGIAAYAILVAPQVLHAMAERKLLIERESWPHTLGYVVRNAPELLASRNALLEPTLIPPAVLPLALLALLVSTRPHGRRFRAALLAVGLVWMTFYYIDLSAASLPRLHVVFAIPCLLVIADMAGDLVALRPARARWLGPAAAAGVLAAVAAGVPANVRWYWQPTNERTEEALFREAVAALPTDRPVLLVHYGGSDGDPDRDEGMGPVHTHHPNYLLRANRSDAFAMSIGDLLAAFSDPRAYVGHPALDPAVQRFFLQGMRCYSKARAPATPPLDTFFGAACQSIRDHCDLQPVFEREVPNYGDLALHYYPAQPTFTIGLYRIVDCTAPR